MSTPVVRVRHLRWTLFVVAFAAIIFINHFALTERQLPTLSPSGDITLSGTVEYAEVTIPAGVKIFAANDLEIVSRGDVAIHGDVIGADGVSAHDPRASSRGEVHRNGVSISIRSEKNILVTGQLQAGNGASGNAPGQRGGAGGSIELESRHTRLAQDIFAGSGGAGGPGAPGGDGGSIVAHGFINATRGQETFATGGKGGRGGDGVAGDFDTQTYTNFRDGGAGGKGGGVVLSRADGEDGGYGPDGEDSLVVGFDVANPGQPGQPGNDGQSLMVIAVGGPGGPGGDGTNATPTNGNGGNGGPGGEGGYAAGGGGETGGRGGACAGGNAGDGGDGGSAGQAFGGNGGVGGNGGSGMGTGSGGTGGEGGLGGDACAGIGGDGGKGGPCCVAAGGFSGGDGGNGGAEGLADAGDGGRGGNGGNADPAGVGGNGGPGGNGGDATGSFSGEGGDGGKGFVPGAGGIGGFTASHGTGVYGDGGSPGSPGGSPGANGMSGDIVFGTLKHGGPGGPCVLAGVPKPEWIKESDADSGTPSGPTITKGIPNGLFRGGHFNNSYGTQDTVVNSEGITDLYLTKLNDDGSEKWTRTVGGTDAAISVNQVQADANGNVLVVGSITGSADFGGTTINAGDTPDGFITKFDCDGNIVWTKQLPEASMTSGNGVSVHDVKIAPNGNIYVVAQFTGSASVGDSTFTTTTPTNMFVSCYSSLCTFHWAKHVIGTTDDFLELEIDESGRIVVGGEFAGSLDFGDSTLVANGSDLFLGWFKSDGSFDRAKKISSSSGYLQDLTAAAGGELYAAGYFSGALTFDGQPTLTGTLSAYLAKLDSTGEAEWVWTHNVGSTYFAYALALDVEVRSSGNVLLAGGFIGSIEFGPHVVTSGDGNNGFLAEFDPSGTAVWGKQFGDDFGQNVAHEVVDGPSGKIIVTGAYSPTLLPPEIDGVPLDSLGNRYDVQLSDDVISSTPDVPVATQTRLSNYPNPFNPTTTIAFTLPHAQRVSLRVYDVKGRLVRELINGRRPAGKNEIVWDGVAQSGQLASSGVYFYRLTTADRVVSRKMVLIK